MTPLRISPPQTLHETACFHVAEKLDAARNIQYIEPFTRLLSCRHCSTPFCTGVQRIREVCNLQGAPYPDLFLVREATNLRLSETVDTVATARLHSRMCLAVQTVSCQQCASFAGYKVIAVEGANRNTTENVNANASTSNANANASIGNANVNASTNNANANANHNQVAIDYNQADEIAIGQYMLHVRFLDIP